MLFRLQATIPVIPFPQLYNYNRHQLTTPLKHFQRIVGKLSFFYQELGYCPQFDAVWKTITIEEHLAVYAAIRGIPPNQIKPLVTRYSFF